MRSHNYHLKLSHSGQRDCPGGVLPPGALGEDESFWQKSAVRLMTERQAPRFGSLVDIAGEQPAADKTDRTAVGDLAPA